MGCPLLLQANFSTQGSNQSTCVSCFGRQVLCHWADSVPHSASEITALKAVPSKVSAAWAISLQAFIHPPYPHSHQQIFTQGPLQVWRPHTEGSETSWRQVKANTAKMFLKVNLMKLLDPFPEIHTQHQTLRKSRSGTSWWVRGWESAWQYRRHGFPPWSGNIPHSTEQPCTVSMEPGAAAAQPVGPELLLPNRRCRRGEWLPLAATEKSACSDKDPAQPKGNKLVN